MGRSGNDKIDQSTALLEGARPELSEGGSELNLAGLELADPLTLEDLRFVRDKYRQLTSNRRSRGVLPDREQARLVRIAKQILAITNGDPRAANFRGLNHQEQLEEKIRLLGLFHSERVLQHIWEIMSATHRGLVVNKAMGYRGREGFSNDQEAYIAAGDEAVLQAIVTFDFSRGFQFNTWFAKKVWGKQTNEARSSGFGIAAGSTWDARVNKVKRLTKEMEQYGWVELLSITRGQLEEEGLSGEALVDRLTELTLLDRSVVASYVYAIENAKNPRIAIIAEQLWAENKNREKVRDLETARERLYADVEHIMTRNRHGVTSLDKEISTNDGSVLIGDAVADEDVDVIGEVIDRLDNERVREIVERMDPEDATTLTKAEQLLVGRLMNIDGDQPVSQKQMHDGVWEDAEGNLYSIDEAVVREWGRRHREDPEDAYGGVVTKVNAQELRELREAGVIQYHAGNGDAAALVEAVGQPLNQNQIQNMQSRAETKLLQRLESSVEGLRAIAGSAKAIEKSEGMREVIRREIIRRIDEAGGAVEVPVIGKSVTVRADDLRNGKLVVRSDHKNEILSLARHFGILNSKTATISTGAIADWTPVERKQTKGRRSTASVKTPESTPVAKPSSIIKAPAKEIDAELLSEMRAVKTHQERIILAAQHMVSKGKTGVTVQDMHEYYVELGETEPKWQDAFSNARGFVKNVSNKTFAPRTDAGEAEAEPVVAAPPKINKKAVEAAALHKRLTASGVTAQAKGLAIIMTAAYEAGEVPVSKERIAELIEMASKSDANIKWSGEVEATISNATRKSSRLICSVDGGYAPTTKAFELLAQS